MAVASAPLTIGKRYRLIDRLGKGGMGEVYRAVDRVAGAAPIALKCVTTPTTQLEFAARAGRDQANLRLSLEQEFRLLASLRHPHIISVLDFGFDEAGRPFFTMDLLENARTILQAGWGKPLHYQIGLLIQMLEAVAYLHRRGVIHRDLKPGNVLVSGDTVRVLDFGVSVLRSVAGPNDGVLAGTMAYMAPELLEGEPASEASDLYAVGMIAYELLAGQHPFDVGNIGKLMVDILSSEPDLSTLRALTPLERYAPTGAQLDQEDDTMIMHGTTSVVLVGDDAGNPVDLPARLPNDALSLAGVVGRLLAKAPERRYPDAQTVIADLSALIGEPLPPERDAVRESFLQAARFVGRDSELACLTSALGDTLNRRGSVWLVGGESGVGKSRLLDELRARALVSGAQVLRGQGVSGGGLPYELWREPLRILILSADLTDLEASILKELVPDIGTLLGDDDAPLPVADAPVLTGKDKQQRLILTMLSVLRRQTQPLVLILEDLQWTEESLNVLERLAPFVPDLPLLVIGSYRNDERPDLPEQLPDANLLMLDRLTPRAMAELSAAMLGGVGTNPRVLALLQRETEGNAFFLIETVRALAEEAGRLSHIGRQTLPEQVFAGGVQAVLRRRLSRVPGAGRPLLKLAAVAGRELDLEVLRAAVALTDDQTLETLLAGCANAAVLEAKEGRWRFAHDKLREALLTDLPGAERADLHRQVAEGIEAAYPDDKRYAAVLVTHWRAAGDTDKETYYAQIAGEQALLASSYREALGFFSRAITLLPSDSAPCAYLMTRGGEACWYLGDYPAAAEYLENALKLARAHHDQASVAHGLFYLSQVTAMQGEFARADALLHEALPIAQQLNNPLTLANIFYGLGDNAWRQEQLPAAREHLQASLAVIQNMPDAAQTDVTPRINTLMVLGVIAFLQQDVEAAQEYYEACRSLAQAAGNRERVAVVLNNLGVLASDVRGDYAEARRYQEEALVIAREIGLRRHVALYLGNMSDISMGLDDWDAARGYAHEALSQAHALGAALTVLQALDKLARIRAHDGDPDGALDLLGAVLNHPACDADLKRNVQDKSLIHVDLDGATVEAGLARGAARDFDAVVAELLADCHAAAV
ncbi:MAG: tetratricopeptide repeat protein [Chloroflexi bacterium]|nr:tetratricopeptide repeat protein [Chloroflexota bacterium]